MKLHLPKLLLTAVLVACSMSEAAMTTPVAGTEGYIWTWNGSQWTRDSDNSVSTPTRVGDVGAFMVVNADLSTNPNTSDSRDTSDGGGVHVKEGVQATDMVLGKWAGTIQVDAGAYLNAWAEYLKNVNADTTVASVWVDGELNLRGFNNWDAKSTAQNWHIGKNGYINLANTSSIGGTASWNIELIHDKQEEAEIEGLTNRIRTNTAQFTRTFISAAGDISGKVTSLTVYDSAGKELVAGRDYTTSHSAKGLGISYYSLGYANVDLTWAGGESDVWVEKGTCWVDASGTATSFLNDDNVTFAAAAEGVSTVVMIGNGVVAGTVTINDNYTFTATGAATLGNVTLAEGKTLTFGGTGTLTVDGAVNGNLNMAGGTLNSGAISGDVKVTGGTLNLKGAEAITGSKLDIAGGTVFIDCNSGATNASAINKDTAVSIGAGGKLHIKGHDSMGWGSEYGITLASISLKGTDADNIAELVLEDSSTTWGGKNSIGYELNMQGYSAVTGINGNNLIPGASVTASGVGNSITFDFLQVSHAWNVTVNQGGQLTIHATSTGTAADRKQTIIKMGTGDLTLTGSFNSAVEVQGGTMVVGSTGRLAGAISVAGGATFEIATNDAAHNGTLLTRATGTGDVLVTSNTTLSAGARSQAKGNLTISNATLTANLGKNNSMDLSTFTSWTLDKATIYYHGAAITLNNVEVSKQGAELQFEDMKGDGGNCDVFTLAGTTTLRGDFAIKTKTWKSITTIENLGGTGNLSISSGSQANNKTVVNIQQLSAYQGDISMTQNTGALILNLSGKLNAGTSDNATSIGGTGEVNVTFASTSGNIIFETGINLTGSLSNTGLLSLNGLNVTGTEGLTAVPSGDTPPSYSAGENGYLASSYYVIQNGEGGSLTANNLSGYTFAGSVLAAENGKFEQDSNGSLLLTLTGAGIYYVNTDVTLGGEAASPGVANATGFIINNGGHLKLNTALTGGMTSGISVTDNANASITLTGGITLSHGNTVTTGEGAKVSYTVDGATLNIDTLANTNIETVNVTNSGTLYLKEATAKLGEEGKYVSINLSNKGKFAFDNGNGSGAKIYANINVDGEGELIGSYFGNDSNIYGDITGADNSMLKLSQRADSTNSWTISGDISGNMAIESNTWVTLSGNNTYSGGTTITGAKLTTASEYALGKGAVKMQGGTLEMAAALSVTAMEYTSGTVNNGSHGLNVGTLTVAEDATMSLGGTGTTTALVVDLKNGASLSSAGALTMGSLTMGDGSKLATSSTITLSGSDNRVLNLGSGLTLDGEWFNNLLAELTGTGTAVLFDGVTEFKLNGVAYANQVDLADHFLNVEQGKYYLAYADSVVYAGLGEVIPEPTTATLSLLALMGLAARRRRK